MDPEPSIYEQERWSIKSREGVDLSLGSGIRVKHRGIMGVWRGSKSANMFNLICGRFLIFFQRFQVDWTYCNHDIQNDGS